MKPNYIFAALAALVGLVYLFNTEYGAGVVERSTEEEARLARVHALPPYQRTVLYREPGTQDTTEFRAIDVRPGGEVIYREVRRGMPASMQRLFAARDSMAQDGIEGAFIKLKVGDRTEGTGGTGGATGGGG